MSIVHHLWLPTQRSLERFVTEKLVNYSSLRRFSCQVHVCAGVIAVNDGTKLQIMHFYGIWRKVMKGYKFWDLIAQKILINNDVVFKKDNKFNLNTDAVYKQVEAQRQHLLLNSLSLLLLLSFLQPQIFNFHKETTQTSLFLLFFLWFPNYPLERHK